MDLTIEPGTGSPASTGGCGGGTCTCGKGDQVPELDVRAIPTAVRHAAVHGVLGAIPVSGSIVLAAPHEPLPLLAELAEQHPGEFDVSYVERGPVTWRLAVTRRK